MILTEQESLILNAMAQTGMPCSSDDPEIVASMLSLANKKLARPKCFLGKRSAAISVKYEITAAGRKAVAAK
jgi:hypothetical protein